MGIELVARVADITLRSRLPDLLIGFGIAAFVSSTLL